MGKTGGDFNHKRVCPSEEFMLNSHEPGQGLREDGQLAVHQSWLQLYGKFLWMSASMSVCMYVLFCTIFLSFLLR